MAKTQSSLLRKLIFRIDGAADSKKVYFTSAAGRRWEAELSLHSGTDAQAPRLMVLLNPIPNESPEMPLSLPLS